MTMVDQKFHQISGPYTITEIAKQIGCDIYLADSSNICDVLIHSIKSLKEAGAGDITFLSNRKYLKDFNNSKASACIVPADITIEQGTGADSHGEAGRSMVLLHSKAPYVAYKKLIDLFYKCAKPYPCVIKPSAYIANSAKIGKNCYIGHNVVIEDNAQIGDNSIIESGSFIDHGVLIGKGAFIHAGVSISYAEIGDNVVILSGARIGQDGFGFATENGVHYKIYHAGKVIIGDNVEIGSNSTIDRGSISDTIIEDFCRIDNLVQIAHNVHIGRGAIIAAQTGIAGSSKIGAYSLLGGQVGVAGHITIGEQSQVAAQSGVIQDVEPKSIIGGTPSVPVKDWHRQTIIMKKLIKERNLKEGL